MHRLSTTDRALCATYAVIAAVALVATWWHNLAYASDFTDLGGLVDDLYANHAVSSAVNDLLLVALAAMIWMVVEGRRLGMPHLWLWPVLALAVAISVALPAFLVVRQLRLAAGREAKAAPAR